MDRTILFLFLVVAVPLGVYWAGNGFEPPAAGLERFAHEASALRGTLGRHRTAPPLPEKEPEAAPVEPAEPEPPAREEPPVRVEPPSEPATPPGPPARQLFDEGRFAEAAQALRGVDEAAMDLALLGAAFAKAFPPSVPEAPYVRLRTQAGATFEGFAVGPGPQVQLLSATGRSLSFPSDAIAERTEIPRGRALDEAAERIRTEGAGDVTGMRLFALVHEAFALGRPDAAAPLLPRLLELDATDPFFLSAVRHRAPLERQADLYRAFAACMKAPPVPEPPAEPPPVATVAQAPRRLGNGTPRLGTKTDVHDAGAMDLIREAAPLRKEAERLHRRNLEAGLDAARLDEVEEAIRLMEGALALYEKALEREDSDEIYALIRHCSRTAYQLRMWKDQLGGR